MSGLLINLIHLMVISVIFPSFPFSLEDSDRGWVDVRLVKAAFFISLLNPRKKVRLSNRPNALYVPGLKLASAHFHRTIDGCVIGCGDQFQVFELTSIVLIQRKF